MHGPGLPPQHGHHGHRPLSGGEMTLRVLFTALPVLSCGFFAWGTMLRLAVLTRKARDWVLLVLSGALSVAWITLIGMDPTQDVNGWQGNLGAGGSIFTGFAVCVYYLISDIRHQEARALTPAAPWYPAAPQTPYGGRRPSPPTATRPCPRRPPRRSPRRRPRRPRRPASGRSAPNSTSSASCCARQGPARPPQTPQPGGPYQDPNSTEIQDPNR